MALRIRRFDPNSEIGLMPMAEPGRIFAAARRSMVLSASISALAPAEPAAHSIPAYTSSVFSRKITMFTSCGLLTGEGTPSK